MTPDQSRRIAHYIFNMDEPFSEADKELLPGLHDCPDWDGPICKDMKREWECCTCSSFGGKEE